MDQIGLVVLTYGCVPHHNEPFRATMRWVVRILQQLTTEP